jgi:hypothetical protein
MLTSVYNPNYLVDGMGQVHTEKFHRIIFYVKNLDLKAFVLYMRI